MPLPRLSVTATVPFVLLLCVSLQAQGRTASHHVEISAVAGYLTADGEDFSGTKGAIGVGATARYLFSEHSGLGLGIHYSDHGLKSLPEHLNIRVLYAEGRYSAQLGGAALRIFLGPRVGWAHEDISIVGWTGKGTVIGGLTGLDWRLDSHVSLELQISESLLHLGDLRAADGSVVSGTAAHGSSFGLEGGLAIRF